ncbi:MAG: FtsK/SpoIIIE domain-containing protein, partial [Candidatus Dormibacteraceae bacterium]
ALPCSECPHVPKQALKSEQVSSPVAGPVGTDWREFLSAVPVGRRADGGLWTIPLYNRQGLLVAGKTGGGKSGVIWSLNIGLVPALIAGVVELRGVDPKSIELYRGRDFFAQYADDPEGMIDLLETAVSDMNERKAELRATGADMFEPTTETPLVIVEIDELIMLNPKLMAEPKLAKRAMSAIITLLTQGRAFGYYVVGGIQDPRKEYLDQRDLFQISVALLLENDMAELVLSKAAVRNGANCAAIPQGKDGAGTGYVMDTEQNGDEPMQVRAFWANPAAVKEWAAFLVEARAADEAERVKAAQMVSEQAIRAASDGDGQVIPLPQSA